MLVYLPSGDTQRRSLNNRYGPNPKPNLYHSLKLPCPQRYARTRTPPESTRFRISSTLKQNHNGYHNPIYLDTKGIKNTSLINIIHHVELYVTHNRRIVSETVASVLIHTSHFNKSRREFSC